MATTFGADADYNTRHALHLQQQLTAANERAEEYRHMLEEERAQAVANDAAIRREVGARELCRHPFEGDLTMIAGSVRPCGAPEDAAIHAANYPMRHDFQPESTLAAVRRALHDDPLPDDPCAYKSPHGGLCPMLRKEHNGPFWRRGYPAHSFIRQARGTAKPEEG